MAFLEVRHLAKTFRSVSGDTAVVFEDVEFTIERGEFVCIIGHSGCGKSSILNIIAGLEDVED